MGPACPCVAETAFRTWRPERGPLLYKGGPRSAAGGTGIGFRRGRCPRSSKAESARGASTLLSTTYPYPGHPWIANAERNPSGHSGTGASRAGDDRSAAE